MKIEKVNNDCVELKDSNILLTVTIGNTFLVVYNDNTFQMWIIYSGAFFHVTPHWEWFAIIYDV